MLDDADDNDDDDDDDVDMNDGGSGKGKRSACKAPSRNPSSSSFGMQHKRDELTRLRAQINRLKHFV